MEDTHQPLPSRDGKIKNHPNKLFQQQRIMAISVYVYVYVCFILFFYFI